MRFLLFDRITEAAPGKRLAGVKAVSLSDGSLADHYPRRAVLPPTLVLEAIAQLSGMLNVLNNDFAVEMFLVLIDHVDLTRPVLNGEVLTVEARSMYSHEYGATMAGEATAGGELIARAGRIVFAHEPITDAKRIQTARDRFAYQGGTTEWVQRA